MSHLMGIVGIYVFCLFPPYSVHAQAKVLPLAAIVAIRRYVDFNPQ
jgi:hypothetical protein